MESTCLWEAFGVHLVLFDNLFAYSKIASIALNLSLINDSA
jgi:hypothetical protein